LFTYYLDFAHDGNSDRLDSLQLSSDQAGKSKCAIMTRRLLHLAKDMDEEGRIRESIEKYGERLEKDLLKGFDRAYRRGDLREMRVCFLVSGTWLNKQEFAKVLHDFNGGTSVVQVFVNQHDFFIVREKLEQKPTLWDDETYLYVLSC
jgi:exocyst complex component 5